MADRTIIFVFAKPPVPGNAKTRLATKVGSARAAAIAQALLADTWAAVSALEWARPVLATTEDRAHTFGLESAPELWLQGDGDLGQRLERIVRRGLGEADVVIAIGADTPGLPPHLLDSAREQLQRNDAVLGPCDDGGFYLVGLRRCPPGLFERLPWSSPDTFLATRSRLESAGLRVAVLDPWFDVDRPEDLERLGAAIRQGVLRAPAISRLLADQPGPLTRNELP